MGQPEFRILAEISVIFTLDGAFSRKMSENFPMKIHKKKWKTAQITVKMKKMLKKMGFSKIRDVLKHVKNKYSMWYLALDRKNFRCTEILGFGRNFCHFHFRRSIFPKNVEKFRKMLKNCIFSKTREIRSQFMYVPKMKSKRRL